MSTRLQQKNEASKRYYLKHKDKVKAYNRLRYQSKRNSICEQSRLYYATNRSKVRHVQSTYSKARRIVDPSFRIALNIRTRIKDVLKQKLGIKTDKLLDCSKLELKRHLESQFQPGMSWDNYGQWHIDHIIPVSKVNILDETERNKVAHFTNLQPLWAIDNLRKGNR